MRHAITWSSASVSSNSNNSSSNRNSSRFDSPRINFNILSFDRGTAPGVECYETDIFRISIVLIVKSDACGPSKT